MRNFILGFLIALLLVSAAYLYFGPGLGGPVAPAKVQRYYCPMHPTIIKDHQGDCPICGMRLEPLAEQGTAAAGDALPAGTSPEAPAAGSDDREHIAVHISPERQQLMGITTEEAQYRTLEETIRTVGRVSIDETMVHHVHTKFEGYIEVLYADSVGQFVVPGQPLFNIYSPELVAAQKEYLLALRARDTFAELNPRAAGGGIDYLRAARERLTLWDISDEQLSQIRQSGEPIRALTIHAPMGGYIMAKTAFHGMRVMPSDILYEIADLSRVWVLADVYEFQLGLVHPGQPALMSLAYLPGRVWKGQVEFIYPTLEEKTRTAKVRLVFASQGNELKPEMFAKVELKTGLGRKLAVPDSAVVSTGERDLVFVAGAQGLFEPRQVVAGYKVRNYVEIRSGIQAGERVVVGANFLLDSESRLKAAISAHH